jgi:hypothetical protein
MSNDGEQLQVKQVRRGASGARGGLPLPPAHAPAIVSADPGEADELDAVLAIVPHPPSGAAWRHLPHPARWRELDARAPARAGTVRTTVLANRRHTLAVLGYLGSDASAFERLSLAGRMLKEAAAREPQVLARAAARRAAHPSHRPAGTARPRPALRCGRGTRHESRALADGAATQHPARTQLSPQHRAPRALPPAHAALAR